MKHRYGIHIALLAGLPAMIAGTSLAAGLDEPTASFQVAPRAQTLEFAPCRSCHDDLEPDPQRRVLENTPHVQAVRHGQADLWCDTCHSLDNERSLHTLSGKRVSYDESHIICSQCHSRVNRDWQFGAHGKRLTRWQGQREILNCTACHDPHLDPGIRPRRPEPPPGVRVDLQHQHRAQHRHRHAWERPLPAPSEDTDVSR